jgi:O-antigen ligase
MSYDGSSCVVFNIQSALKRNVVVMKDSVLGKKTLGERGKAFLLAMTIFPWLAIGIAVVLGGLLGILNTDGAALVVGMALLLFVFALGQYELAVTMIVAIHIYVDWYLGLALVAPAIVVGLLLLLFVTRSPQNPWTTPRVLWLWGLFLLLTLYPAIQGAQQRYDLAFYWPNIVFAPLVMFWLGMLIAKNRMHVRTLFQLLAVLGTLLAIHTVIQTVTGTVVFSTSQGDANLAQVFYYQLGSSGVSRSGSFFQNPDWNGTFFATMLILPLGLLTEARSVLQKFLYLSEMVLMSIALLFTYSIGAWTGALAGIFTFVLLAGRGYIRILVPIVVGFIGTVLLIIFPTEINLQIEHLSNPAELALRTGAWQTALNVIRAFPLTGIGMGFSNYLQRAEPYRVLAQYVSLAHPHNSYLELGAMAGLPVLVAFLALLFFALWNALRNWKRVDARTRCLLGGGMAAIIALSINSLSINGWTLPPLASLGWLILGAVASPLLMRNRSDIESESKNT